MIAEASNSSINQEQTTDSLKPSNDMLALIEAIKREGNSFRQEEVREERAKNVREWTTIILVGCTLVAVCWQVFEMIKVYAPILQ